MVGGLYGNIPALEAIEQLARREPARVEIVFNGDFHWFDATSERFTEMDRRVSASRSLRGNVEAELARADDVGAGLRLRLSRRRGRGDSRSDRIGFLSACARASTRCQPVRDQLGRLPMTRRGCRRVLARRHRARRRRIARRVGGLPTARSMIRREDPGSKPCVRRPALMSLPRAIPVFRLCATSI